MSTVPKRNIWLLIAMIICAGAAYGLTPRQKIADINPMPKLENVIPQQFGNWHQIPSSNQIVDPTQQQTLNMIYDQVFSRTFENRDGYRIMLALAYGGNQRDELELHKPEICYVAQGFVLTSKYQTSLSILGKDIPAVRLQLSKGNRTEPVTYWAMVGDTVVHSGYHKKYTELKYGLKGRIPDGVLVRVSSIDGDFPRAFSEQSKFLQELMQAIGAETQQKFIGKR